MQDEPVMDPSSVDARVRLVAFDFLKRQTAATDGILPRALLAEGFLLEGVRVPLLGPQGIFKPAVLPEVPLSITTVPVVPGRSRPYDDAWEGDGLIRYRYRGDDPNHRDNVGLRVAMARQTPLVYLHGIVPGEYLPVWPVYVVGDDPAALTFRVQVDEAAAPLASAGDRTVAEVRRRYVTTTTLHRLHQQSFRLRVLKAYQERCAICRLRRRELLEAAHILPDTHPRGEPVVSNGLALCSLHHAAFDRHIIGVRPDLTVDVRADVLHEADGPMLVYGLQGFHRARLVVPRGAEVRPNPLFLEERYELFRRAG
jgi:putative restriction endonuclease